MERQEYENVRKYLNGEKIQEGEITRTKKQTKGIEIKSDVLYKRRDGKLVKILREDERDSVMFMIHNHETGAHFGVEATYNKIAGRYYWKGMYEDIRKYVRYCDTCQRRGQKGGKGNLHPIKVGEPFERIGIDFVGPLERTKKRKQIYSSGDRLLNKMARGESYEGGNSKERDRIHISGSNLQTWMSKS